MPGSLTDIFSTARERIQRAERYAESVRQLFAQTVNSLLALYKRVPKLETGEMYSLDGDSERLRRQAETILRQLHATALTALTQGITLEWGQANQECDKLVKTAYGKRLAKSPRLYAAMQRNAEALKAFIERSEMGMNLSDRVWQPVRQLRDQLEVALTVGIGEGQSAATMSRKVRQYLNDPDLMFRRFRYKDADGQWQRKWKKRVIDHETGKVTWQDYDRDSYKDQWTGRGYYKSAAANAMRLTRTETNIAYRRADNLRWRQMDFVLGQEIQLSHNHPEPDICDDLKGRYPKDFVFDGWHPQCFCRAVPILIDDDELERQADAWDEGRDYTPKARPVTEMPAAFKRWVKANRDDIERAARKGRAPYFIRNNAAIVDDILGNKTKRMETLQKAEERHNARTDRDKYRIQRDWDKHRVKIAKKFKYGDRAYNELLDEIDSAFQDGDYSVSQADFTGKITRLGRMAKTIERHRKRLPEKINAIKKAWYARYAAETPPRITAPDIVLRDIDAKGLSDLQRAEAGIENIKTLFAKGSYWRGWVDKLDMADVKRRPSYYVKEMKQNCFDEYKNPIETVNHLAALKKVNFDAIPNEWRYDFDKAVRSINKHNFAKKGLFPQFSNIEYVYNMCRLSMNENAIKFGLKRISSKMPYQIFRDFERKIPGFPGAFTDDDKKFFDALGKFVPLYTKNGNGAYCRYGEDTLHVLISLSDPKILRRLKQEWYKRGIFHHEYGHAMDYLNGWHNNSRFQKLYDSFISELAKDNSKSIKDAINQSFQTDCKNNSYCDEAERLGKLSDCVQAATKGHARIGPRGHSASYFNRYGSQIAEFIAHCSENYWSGNDIFEKLAPKIYEAMRKIIEDSLF